MLRAMVFDMDGTLFDTERIYIAAWLAAGKEMNVDGVESAIPAFMGRTNADTRQYFEEKFPDVDYDAFIAARERNYLREIAAHGIPVKPGVRELLEYLRERGVKIALATATKRVRAEENLRTTGLLPYFDVLVTGDMVQRGKPDPETFLRAAELLGVTPADCIGVEDSFNGVRSIAAAGMTTVMIPDMVQPTGEIRALADYVLPDMAALLHKLKENDHGQSNI